MDDLIYHVTLEMDALIYYVTFVIHGWLDGLVRWALAIACVLLVWAFSINAGVDPNQAVGLYFGVTIGVWWCYGMVRISMDLIELLTGVSAGLLIGYTIGFLIGRLMQRRF